MLLVPSLLHKKGCPPSPVQKPSQLAAEPLEAASTAFEGRSCFKERDMALRLKNGLGLPQLAFIMVQRPVSFLHLLPPHLMLSHAQRSPFCHTLIGILKGRYASPVLTFHFEMNDTDLPGSCSIIVFLVQDFRKVARENSGKICP